MLKQLVYLSILLTFSSASLAQKGTITGKLVDHTIGEPLIGATVLIGEGVGTITDLDGNFSITADYGDYTLSISYVGYETITKQIKLDRKLLILKDLPLKTTTLTEVQVVADVARERETPVAFSNILPAKIAEELAAQDLPMILNSTPGVYATQQGGGDGDARVTIRGFSQRNIAVMIDGVPVNDMENGWVYWSNWFGLDAVTRSIQVQRGLGSSKIAIPSVGGTINILTKGIEQKRGMSIKQEVGSYGYTRTSLGYNSGRQENGWGYTFALSYKQRNGFADATFSRGFFYFGKVEKMIGNHIISVTALGAPQRHGQRSYQQPLGTFSEEEALKYMDAEYVDSLVIKDKGLAYNGNWGILNRMSLAPNGDTIWAEDEVINDKLNYYHKPQFSLKDFWNVNDKLSWSNMVYLSVGRGGGTGTKGPSDPAKTADGLLDYQRIYNQNKYNPFLTLNYGDQRSETILYSGINNHMWYGFLSTLNYSLNDNIDISGGADLRYYKGTHYRIVYDLLGGDVWENTDNRNQDTPLKRVGDKFYYHNDGIVKWMGAFLQAEYKTEKLSAFLNLSGSYSGYKRIDYFKNKDIVIGDEVFSQVVGNDDIFFYNGNNYVIAYKNALISESGDTTFVDNSPTGGTQEYILNAATYTNRSNEARFTETKTKWIPGFTVKGGLNYNLTDKMNAFFNLGYISKAPRFENVIDKANKFFREIKNEEIFAFEFGYSYKHTIFAANINAYYTKWKNKPLDRGLTVIIDGEGYSANINGLNALHTGVELDFIYKPLKGLDIQGVISLGNWRWDSGDTVRVFSENGTLLKSKYFNAKGVHVGDAAQSQYSLSIRYEIKTDFLVQASKLYVKGRVTYFDRHYAHFNPFDLDGTPNNIDSDGNPRESWLIPTYYTIDLHLGYGFNIIKTRADLRFSLLNVLNTFYITDAQNNSGFISGSYNDFDAKSASVFVGMPTRYVLSLKITI